MKNLNKLIKKFKGFKKVLKRIRKVTRDSLFYTTLSVFSATGIGITGCDMATDEIVDDSSIQKENNINSAIDYIIGELQKRGYDQIERGNLSDTINQFFLNPDTGDIEGNIYEIHAYNPTTGDEQWWEIDNPENPVFLDLVNARQGMTPDLIGVESYDKAYLDSLIDYYCSN